MSRPSLKERLQGLFAEYGTVAIGTYFGLFFLVLGGFALALSMGVSVDGASGGATVLGGAYIATKLTQPLRILATLVLTPAVASVVRRFRPREQPAPPSESSQGEEPAPPAEPSEGEKPAP